MSARQILIVEDPTGTVTPGVYLVNGREIRVLSNAELLNALGEVKEIVRNIEANKVPSAETPFDILETEIYLEDQMDTR